MHTLDKYGWLDLEFLKHVFGEGGAKRLHDRFLQTCLPDEQTCITVAGAMGAAGKLLHSDLFKFVSASSQGSVKAAISLLQQLHLGQCPMTVQQPTAFLAEVWRRLAFFVKAETAAGTGGEPTSAEVTKQTLYGTKALLAKWEPLKTKAASELQLAGLEVFSMYAWLLPADVRQATAGMIAAVSKEAVCRAAKGRAASSKGKSAQQGARKPASAADADAERAAMQLLGI